MKFGDIGGQIRREYVAGTLVLTGLQLERPALAAGDGVIRDILCQREHIAVGKVCVHLRKNYLDDLDQRGGIGLFGFLKHQVENGTLPFRTVEITVDLTDTRIGYALAAVQVLLAALRNQISLFIQYLILLADTVVDRLGFSIGQCNVKTAERIDDIGQNTEVNGCKFCDIQIEIGVEHIDGEFGTAVSIGVCGFGEIVTIDLKTGVTVYAEKPDLFGRGVDAGNHDRIGTGAFFERAVAGINTEESDVVISAEMFDCTFIHIIDRDVICIHIVFGCPVDLR